MIALIPPLDVVYNETFLIKQFEKTLIKSIYDIRQKGSDMVYKVKINPAIQEQHKDLKVSFFNGINSLQNPAEKIIVSALIESFLPFFLEMNPSKISLEFTYSQTLFLFTIYKNYNIHFEVYPNEGKPNYTVSIYEDKKILLSDYGEFEKILSEISETINFYPITNKGKHDSYIPVRNFATA